MTLVASPEPYGAVKKFEITYESDGGWSNPNLPNALLLVPAPDFDMTQWRKNPSKKHMMTAYVTGITEEGYSNPNWFEVEMRYPDGSVCNFERLRKGPSTAGLRFGSDKLSLTERGFLTWLRSINFSYQRIPLTVRTH